ncbi:MAG: hypothetical protein Q7S88_01070 [Candidatus Daviesbacteria bacterium]|nr:hypothetical protein [Candidatus Daviesbacteria bacterium]
MPERPPNDPFVEQRTQALLGPESYNPRDVGTVRNRMTGTLVALGASYGISLLASPEIGMNSVNLLLGAAMAFYVVDGLLATLTGKPLPMTSAILRRTGLIR